MEEAKKAADDILHSLSPMKAEWEVADYDGKHVDLHSGKDVGYLALSEFFQ